MTISKWCRCVKSKELNFSGWFASCIYITLNHIQLKYSSTTSRDPTLFFCSKNYSVRVPLACQANKEISPDRQEIPIKPSGSSTKLKSRSKIATKPLSANPKEHDVDDLLERTLTEGNQSDSGNILTQVIRNILIITCKYTIILLRSNPWLCHGYMRYTVFKQHIKQYSLLHPTDFVLFDYF